MTQTQLDVAAAPARHVTVLADRCAGCQECVIRCPTGALSMNTRLWIADAHDEACVGCRQCVRTCPFSAITVDGPALVAPRVELEPRVPTVVRGDRTEVRPGLAGWEQALVEADRCLSCPDPTCVRGCPAHNDIPGFISAVADRDLAGAHRILAATTVLPDVCSRVCDQSAQCEGACTWSLAGGVPVAIGALERFVTDHAAVPSPTPVSDDGVGLHVAVVGSGPAGIGAAWELREAGARVTVYEKEAVAGGLLRWGIPEFTLPDEVAARPWDQLQAAGVELRCGTGVGPDQVEGLLATHDAVILCHGAGAALRLPVPGAELPGVEDATSFLTRARAALTGSRGLPELDRPSGQARATVLVLGAGNTAMDVARTALRLGARPVCVDWMDARFAPVRPDELAEAQAEGVEVLFCTTLQRLEARAGRVGLAHLAATRQDRADQRPRVLKGTVVAEPVDLVVMAMGYRSDPAFASVLDGTPLRRQAAGLPDRRWQASGLLSGPASAFAHRRPVGALALGREAALAASVLPLRERTWAAGDALVGPSTVVEAMAQGRRAARGVLTARPRRPGRPAEPLRRVLVAYESGSGTTRAADILAEAFAAAGVETHAMPLTAVGPVELAAADLVVVGSRVSGLPARRARPAAATRAWLATLPRLPGKRTATFCTYEGSPNGALEAMRHALQATGASVVGEASFRSSELARAASPSAVRAFALDLLNGSPAPQPVREETVGRA